MQVSLKGSKTDPIRHGVKITVGRTGDKLCPVATMLAYTVVRGASRGPLFKFKSSRPLTRPCFVSKVWEVLAQIGFPAERYAGQFSSGRSYNSCNGGNRRFPYPNAGSLEKCRLPSVLY